MEDHRKPLVGSGVTSPFALAGVWALFGTHDGQSTYRLSPEWNLLLWFDAETDRWYVTCPDDLGYYITPQYPYWVGPQGDSPVGDYEPAPGFGASGTLTIREKLIGTGETTPAILAGTYEPFGLVNGLPRWKLAGQTWYLWHDNNRWVIAPMNGDMPVEPNLWTLTVHWENGTGPLGDYTPAHSGATGTLTIS